MKSMHMFCCSILLLLMNSLGHAHQAILNPWTIEVAIGMTGYDDKLVRDSHTASERLSLGLTLLTKSFWQIGLEAGFQTGSTLLTNFPKETFEAPGGVPIQAEVQPLMDVLVSLRFHPPTHSTLIPWIKGGVAYRELHSDRYEVNNVTLFKPEMQFGIGYPISKQALFSLNYQIIWGNPTQLTLNPNGETALLCNIPRQQALWLGIRYQFL